MNIRQIKKVNRRFVALGLVLLALVTLGLWSHYKSVSGAQGDPEAQMQDLLGNERSSFSVGESGFLNLRAYSEGIPGYVEQLDIVLAVDISNSMSGNKIVRAKQFVSDFVDSIDPRSDVYIGLVSFNKDAYLNSNLIDASVAANRQYIKDSANQFTLAACTDINGGVELANNLLINSTRPNATKYIVLISDGGEACANQPGKAFLNGSLFKNSGWIDNVNAGVVAGTTLDTSIKNSIKFRTVYVKRREGDNDMSNPDELLHTGNGGLMRFIAARSNGVSLPPSITRWDVEFGAVPEIDNQLLFLFTHDNINEIYHLIEGMSGVKLKYFVKVAPQARVETLYSAVDKGGRSELVTMAEVSPGLYEITTDDPVSYTYRCGSEEASCLSNAVLHDDGTYWIENNYLDIKIKIKFVSLGVFDLLSNYTGCETGPLRMVGQDSRVEYYDPRDDAKYKTLYFKSLCVRVAESSPSIIKTSYATDPGDDLTNPTGVRQATFDAGDDVWIVLEIDDSTPGRLDWRIEDKVPESVSGKVDYSYYQGSNKVKSGRVNVTESKVIFSGQQGNGSQEALGALAAGKNYIKYRFKI